MKRLFLLSVLAAAPVAALAQTTNDDTVAAENWWDRVGAAYFSDENLMTPRPEYEIMAQWTGLSADDQAAVKARCAELAGQGNGTAVSTQTASTDAANDDDARMGEGNDSGTEENVNAEEGTSEAEAQPTSTETALTDAPEAAADSDTTLSGATAGAENQVAGEEVPGYTGLGGSDPTAEQMTPVCTLVQEL